MDDQRVTYPVTREGAELQLEEHELTREEHWDLIGFLDEEPSEFRVQYARDARV